MKLSRTVAYAVRATLQLAKSDSSTPVPCSQLAAEGKMPERFLLQILRNLVTHGILRSTRGVDGGYSLVRPPNEISLLEVIEAIEGPFNTGEPLSRRHVDRNTEPPATSPATSHGQLAPSAAKPSNCLNCWSRPRYPTRPRRRPRARLQPMPDDSQAFDARLKLARQAARDAGDADAKVLSQRHLAVERKADNSPVTMADREAEQLLAQADRGYLPRRRHRGRGIRFTKKGIPDTAGYWIPSTARRHLSAAFRSTARWSAWNTNSGASPA